MSLGSGGMRPLRLSRLVSVGLLILVSSCSGDDDLSGGSGGVDGSVVPSEEVAVELGLGSTFQAQTPTPVSELGFADGDVELQIFTAGESDFGPRYVIENQWLKIVTEADVDAWWATVLPEAGTRASKIESAMAKSEIWTGGIAVDPDHLELAPSRKVVTNEVGHLVMGIQPGSYLVCTVFGGWVRDDGRVRPTILQDCGEVVVDGSTTWTLVERSGEAGATTIESEPTLS